MRADYESVAVAWLDGNTLTTRRNRANFTDTASVSFALTDDAANGEVEIAGTVIAGGVGCTHLKDKIDLCVADLECETEAECVQGVAYCYEMICTKGE